MKSCNQCHGELTRMYWHLKKVDSDIYVYVCSKAVCPNYGVVQIPVEDMPSEQTQQGDTLTRKYE